MRTILRRWKTSARW